MKNRMRQSSSSVSAVSLRVRWAAVIGVMSVFLSGCSFIFSHRSHEYVDETGAVPRTTFVCPGNVPPVLDTIWGTLNLLGALRAVAADPNEWDRQDHYSSRNTTIAVGLGWLALSGASAIYGFTEAVNCKAELRRSRDIEDSWLRGPAGKRKVYSPPPTRPGKGAYEAPPPPSEESDGE